MTIRPANARPPFYTRGLAQTATIQLREAGTTITPATGCTLTVYDADGTAITGLDGVDVTEGASSTFAIGAAVLDEVALGKVTEEWQMVLTGRDNQTFHREAYVCLLAPYPPCSDVQLSALLYDSANLAPTSDAGWDDKLDLSWDLIVTWLLSRGIKVWEITSWHAFTRWHLYSTAKLIADDLKTYEASDGKWSRLAEEYALEAASAMGELGYGRDADGDLVADTTGQLMSGPADQYLATGPARWGGGAGRRW